MCWSKADNTKSALIATTATSFPASTKDSAKSGLRSCRRQSSSAVVSLRRDIEVEAHADAALIKEADGRAIPINALKLSRTTRVIMPGATYCAELRRCCEKR